MTEGWPFEVGRDSVGGIKTCYGLDGTGIESRGGGMRFCAPLQTGHWPQPSSCTTDNGRLPRGESGRGVAYNTRSHLVPRLKKPLLPLWAFMVYFRVKFIFSSTFTFTFTILRNVGNYSRVYTA